MELVRPSSQYLESFIQLCEETWNDLFATYILRDPAKVEEWKTTLFEEYKNQEKGRMLPASFVPSVTYWVVEEPIVVGVLNIRTGTNEFIRRVGGQIGWAIRKSLWRQKYATRLIPIALGQARQLGLRGEIEITCFDPNKGGLATLKKTPFHRYEKETLSLEGQLYSVHRFFYQ